MAVDGFQAQPPLQIATVKKSSREEFRISLKDFSDGTTKAEVRIFERRRDGDWEPTPRHVVIGRDFIGGVAEGLLRARSLLEGEIAA
ncbi:hypothetical protein QY049_37425 [Bradyrhizobium sp. WYCCWR 13022]|uniref:hypothetical protein n=1 Tax=unclassified Bradyrhizobium TaxID=2631580 RepID=UPI00263AABCA|nr:hypothetical protein [Bradyrhizobium sp. WYCCWR 13022]MDN4988830.1 hypothetical protein [Bradyrhizobium sp. WYCCWR 13022]